MFARGRIGQEKLRSLLTYLPNLPRGQVSAEDRELVERSCPLPRGSRGRVEKESLGRLFKGGKKHPVRPLS